MIYLLISCLITLLVFIVVLAPFFVGKGGRLAPAASINDVAQLQSVQSNIIKRYISEEKSRDEGSIPENTWKRRREFLESKYIDVSRRIDYLNKLQERLKNENT